MLDIKFIRDNPDVVKENIRKKFQDAKLPLVDEVLKLDAENRSAISEASDLRAQKNRLSKANGPLFGKLKKASEEEKAAIQAEIDANMAKVRAEEERLAELEKKEEELAARMAAWDQQKGETASDSAETQDAGATETGRQDDGEHASSEATGGDASAGS